MRISDWSSDVCSSDLRHHRPQTDRADRRDRLACAHRAADEGQVVKAIALALLLTFSAAAAAAATAYAVAPSTTELTPTQPERYEALTHDLRRPEERRVGKEWISTGRLRRLEEQ